MMEAKEINERIEFSKETSKEDLSNLKRVQELLLRVNVSLDLKEIFYVLEMNRLAADIELDESLLPSTASVFKINHSQKDEP